MTDRIRHRPEGRKARCEADRKPVRTSASLIYLQLEAQLANVRNWVDSASSQRRQTDLHAVTRIKRQLPVPSWMSEQRTCSSPVRKAEEKNSCH